MAKNQPLQGIGVLVTRPKPQAQALSILIEQAGGHAIPFPTLIIKEPHGRQKALSTLTEIAISDWLFFVSANAVHYAAKLLGGHLKVPQQTKIAAIGKATEKALSQYHLSAHLAPSQSSNSEALIAQLEGQNINQKKCMIIRGEGGREVLKHSLQLCGATVSYAEVYRRDCPNSDTTQLISDWKKGEIDYVTATSGETLKNLITLIGSTNRELLTQTPLITVSKRIEEMAYNAGIKRVILSKQPYNETLIETLIEHTG